MSTELVATFFGLLLLGGAIGIAALAVRASGRATIREVAVPLSAAVAVGATAGSLYFSEVAGYVPCELCWAQRIAMYPLAIILTIAAFRRDRAILSYAGVLSILGLGISAYHIQLQLFPDQGSFCEVANPCTGRWVEAFGWMTIPQMAGISFAVLLAITMITLFTTPEEIS
ncbi:MAG: disulfide bond formation protein B [Acidimicrobiales bacterium]